MFAGSVVLFAHIFKYVRDDSRGNRVNTIKSVKEESSVVIKWSWNVVWNTNDELS